MPQFSPTAQAWLNNTSNPSASNSASPKVMGNFSPTAQQWLTTNTNPQTKVSTKAPVVQPTKPQAPQKSFLQNYWDTFTSFLDKVPELPTLHAGLISPVPEKNTMAQAKQVNPVNNALVFAGNMAGGYLNSPAEAGKAVSSLSKNYQQNTSTPQQVAADVASIAMVPLLFLGGGEAAGAKGFIEQTAKSTLKDTLVQVGKKIGKDAIIGGGFGLLGGIQSGKNITNLKDYVNNIVSNTATGLAIGAGAGAVVHGSVPVAKNIIVPLAKGVPSKLGAIFIKDATTEPKIVNMHLDPQVAQNVVLGNEKLSKSSAGKAILKESMVAQGSSGHIAISPSEDGKYTLPTGDKVNITTQPIYDPKTKYDTPEIVAARAEQAKVSSTDTINTPERQQFREDLAQKLYDNGGYANKADRPLTEIKSNKRADIVTGLPGSGKNTVISEPLIRQHGSVLIDSDEAKIGIPESKGGSYNGAVHKESTDVAHAVLGKAMDKGNNIVIPRVGTHIDDIRAIRDELIKEGYNVHLHHNEVSLDTSVHRAITRYKKSGKFVDPDYIVNTIGLKPNKNYDILKQEKEFTSYEKYNNDVKPGESPKLLESSSYEADHNGGKNARPSKGPGGVRGEINGAVPETKTTEQSGLNTRKNSEQSPNEPVGTGKLKTSKVYEHTAERLLALDPERFKDFKDGQPYYNVAKAKEQVEMAANFIEKDPQKAFSVAMGYENPPSGLRPNDVSIALSDRALAEKNDKLMAQLETSMSLRNTREGQDIAALRGRGNENSPHAFIQQVMSQRLNKLGKSSLTDAIDMTKRVVGKTGKQVSSVKERAVARIDIAAERLSKQLKRQQAKIQSAQSLLDQLTCK